MALRRAILAALFSAACASTPARLESHLAPLSFLLGCWDGTFAGGDAHDSRCFSVEHDGGLRDVHVVIGTNYNGETHYDWGAQEGRVLVRYSASDGGAMEGVLAITPEGLSMHDARYVGGDGLELRLRTRWLREGDDQFSTVTEQRRPGGEWTQLMRIDYVRRR